MKHAGRLKFCHSLLCVPGSDRDLVSIHSFTKGLIWPM